MQPSHYNQDSCDTIWMVINRCYQPGLSISNQYSTSWSRRSPDEAGAHAVGRDAWHHRHCLNVTGVPIVDSGVAAYLNKTIQAARLKGARTIVTGVSDAVAETIVDLGIDWGDIETLRDLQTGLGSAITQIKQLG